MLANWLEECGSTDAQEKAESLSLRMDTVRAALPQPTR
jgi:hypothetical protein